MVPPLVLVVLCFSLLSEIAASGPVPREHPLPTIVDSELGYLLNFVGRNPTDARRFEIRRIANVLGFVAADKPAGTLYVATPHNGTTAAYLEVDVRRSVPEAFRCAYDPELPAMLAAPSTVRTAYWKHVDRNALKALWETPTGDPTELHVVGTEHVVNTPDEHTGAYYAYDLDRTLLRYPYRKGAVFVSLSSQRGRSDVGLQGLILGPDAQWNYLYTGKTGLRWPGLGWVESYMYDSYSAAFYLTPESAPSTTRLAVVKWLRAGWSGLNVVSSRHIFDGLDRFGRAFKQVVENPRTLNIDALSPAFAAWKQRSTEELRRLAAEYFADLRARFPEAAAANGLDDSRYLASLTREELLAIVQLEQTKASLGMPSAMNRSSTPKLETRNTR